MTRYSFVSRPLVPLARVRKGAEEGREERIDESVHVLVPSSRRELLASHPASREIGIQRACQNGIYRVADSRAATEVTWRADLSHVRSEENTLRAFLCELCGLERVPPGRDEWA